MWQEIVRIHFPSWLPFFGGSTLPIYGYGVMLVLGFFTSMKLAQYLARRSKLDPELFANAALIALVTGVVGARLSHVCENYHEYFNSGLSVIDSLKRVINIREGGLTYYGGFLLAFPSLVIYGLAKGVSIRLGMDILAPCIMLALALGRVGCFLNGCCYGAECKASWAVRFPYLSDAYVTEFQENRLSVPVPRQLVRNDSPLAQYMDAQRMTELREPMPADFAGLLEPAALKSKETVKEQGLQQLAASQESDPVHPAQIYSALTGLLIAAFLLAYFTLPHTPGRVFAAMMIIEGISRYLLEMLRVEPAVVGKGTAHLTFLPPQSYSMVVSVLLVAMGIALWLIFGSIAHSRNGMQSARQPALT